MTQVWIKGGQAVTLGQSDFVASGGEGSIYVKGDTAFKLYKDPTRMVPVDKIRELSSIPAANVIKPERLLVDKLGKPLGYTMRYVPDTVALCQLFPRAYRERNGITPAMTLALVQKLQETVQATHDAGALVVDLNEMNYLVSKTHDDIYAIDVDSYQTAHYPATALMISVRDWTVRNNDWTQLSDWYSFAIVAFMLFVGLHPYKGKHPTLKGFEDRMKAHASVFDPAVGVPKAAYPLDVIPPVYRDWFKAVLHDGKRIPPPSGLVATLATVSPDIRRIQGTNNLSISELFDYVGKVLGYVEHDGRELAWTNQGIWMDGRRMYDAVAGVQAVGFSPVQSNPVLAGRSVSESKLKLFDVAAKAEIPTDLRADDVMGYQGTIYFRNRGRIFRVVLTDVGTRVHASTTLASTCLEHATQLFPGAVVQRLFDSTYITVYPTAASSYHIQMPELDDYKIIEAKFDSGVLMVVGMSKGHYDRLVFRFSPKYDTHDVRVVADITPTGLNFTTLPTGVCVCIDEEERLEVFSKSIGSSTVKQIVDPMLGSDLRLNRKGGQVVFPRGSKLYSMGMT